MNKDRTTDPRSDKEFILQASRLAGIELTPEQLPGVVEHFRRNAQLAELVNSAVLQMQDELGPIWRP